MSTPAWKKAQRQEEHLKQKLEKERMKLYGPSKSPKRTKKVFEEYKPNAPQIRETKFYPSLKTPSHIYDGAKPKPKQYTGDFIVGIATMHKSNLVPVTREGCPKDYATMRRN
jgi:hypothetical protein